MSFFLFLPEVRLVFFCCSVFQQLLRTSVFSFKHSFGSFRNERLHDSLFHFPCEKNRLVVGSKHHFLSPVFVSWSSV